MSIRSLAALTAVLLITAPLAAAATKPALRITSDAPATVSGTGFRPGEAIRVTVTMGAQEWRKTTRAGARGSFAVGWKSVRLNYCASPFAVSARGAKTGTVYAKIPVRECASP
jgi:chitodextrinase